MASITPNARDNHKINGKMLNSLAAIKKDASFALHKTIFGQVPYRVMGGCQSGQMGRTVNPLLYSFEGSNPSLPTMNHGFIAFVSRVERVLYIGVSPEKK